MSPYSASGDATGVRLFGGLPLAVTSPDAIEHGVPIDVVPRCPEEWCSGVRAGMPDSDRDGAHVGRGEAASAEEASGP